MTKLAVEPSVPLRDYLTRMGVLDDYIGLSNESERIRDLVLRSAGSLARGAEVPR